MAFHGKYWSNTSLARKIQQLGGVEVKPTSATMEEWNMWETKNKGKFAYWLTEEMFDRVQDFITWPKNKLNELTYWYENRFVSKTHAVVTELERGVWHECDDLMLHANFQILVDFIREQKAWMNYISDGAMPVSWHKKKWPFRRFVKLNDEENGLAYLDWEMTLKYDDGWMDETHPDFGKPTHQAKAAQVMCELYHWWVYERPNRCNPYQDPWYEEIKSNFGDEYYKEIHRIEKMYEEEDTKMLIRLIKIRGSMWT